MKHKELNDLWKQQTDQFHEWRNSLYNQAAMLRAEVSGILQPAPDGWTDPINGQERHYIELYDITDNPRLLHGEQFSAESITNEGEFIFGVAIAFDHGPDSYPKTIRHIPLAVRFMKRVPQFSFVNSQTKKPESHWEPDIHIFAEALVSKIADYLQFDPFIGPRTRSSIGFL